MLLSGYIGDRYGQRLLLSIFTLTLASVGVALMALLPASNPSGKVAGFYLLVFAPPAFVRLLSLVVQCFLPRAGLLSFSTFDSSPYGALLWHALRFM